MNRGEEADENAINVTAFGLSDVGLVRKNNEDSFVICNLNTGEVGLMSSISGHLLGNHGWLFLVADGMGGEASGEVASQICSVTVPKRMCENLKSLERVSERNFVRLLREAIEYANQVIHQKAQENALYRGMGTTITAAAVFGRHVFVGQVGDSRAYLIRRGRLTQLTRDQTFLNYLKEMGIEVPDDPEKDSRRSILTQAVGSSETVNVKVTYSDVCRGDGILLCSDGLYNIVPAAVMQARVGATEPLADKCRSLIDEANANGGSDNITVVVAEFNGPGLPPVCPEAPVEFREFDAEDFEARS